MGVRQTISILSTCTIPVIQTISTGIHVTDILPNDVIGIIHIPRNARSDVGIYVPITVARTCQFAAGDVDIRSRVGKFSLRADHGRHDILLDRILRR